MENEKFFNLDRTGYKVIYSRELFTDRIIDDSIKDFNVEINKIETGKGGYKVLKDLGSKYLDITFIDNQLDPKEASDVNPMVEPDRYRLSSYMYFIYNNKEIIKLIPKRK